MLSLKTLCVVLVAIICFQWINSLNTNQNKKQNQIQSYFFTQKLDHFGAGNLSRIQFQQKIFIDKTYWSGKKSAPMIVYLGGEGPIDSEIHQIGTINEVAPKLKALVLYIEHRFYGESIPFGNIDVALRDAEVRGCLSSQQTLIDFAEVIQTTKMTFLQPKSRVTVIGCSYSGMLAAWFRLKFPHIAIGGLASSAPIFLSDMQKPYDNVYCDVVSNDFKVTNEKCYERIKKSWDIIDNITTYGGADGHDYLVRIFKLCSPILFVEQLKAHLARVFSYSAQYNRQSKNGLINDVCYEIVRAPENDILGGIAHAVTRGVPCIDLDAYPNSNTGTNSDAIKAWDWQVCNEFIQRQGCRNNTMFQLQPFNLTKMIDYCTNVYQVPPRLNWVSTVYGGYDMQSNLKHFGSNLIFSNGLMDPFSPFGVLEDISETVVALNTKQGSHCLDIMIPSKHDPRWLKQQRAIEEKMIMEWSRNVGLSNGPRMRILWFDLTLVFALVIILDLLRIRDQTNYLYLKLRHTH